MDDQEMPPGQFSVKIADNGSFEFPGFKRVWNHYHRQPSSWSWTDLLETRPGNFS